jgi:hypothetical protein
MNPIDAALAHSATFPYSSPVRARLIRFLGKPAAGRRGIVLDHSRPSPRTPFVAQTRPGTSGVVKRSLVARFKERSG